MDKTELSHRHYQENSDNNFHRLKLLEHVVRKPLWPALFNDYLHMPIDGLLGSLLCINFSARSSANFRD